LFSLVIDSNIKILLGQLACFQVPPRIHLPPPLNPNEFSKKFELTAIRTKYEEYYQLQEEPISEKKLGNL
jgi:hypothetical protein